MRPSLFLIGALVFLSCSGGEKQDIKQQINDSWIAESINEETLVDTSSGSILPRLEINVADLRYMGSDGCNNFNGGIIELDQRSIRFGIAAGTRMMSEDMKIPDLFNTTLSEVMSWEIQEKKLHLFDAGGKELMLLEKSD